MPYNKGHRRLLTNLWPVFMLTVESDITHVQYLPVFIDVFSLFSPSDAFIYIHTAFLSLQSTFLFRSSRILYSCCVHRHYVALLAS